MVGDLEGLVGDGVALRLGRVVTVRPLFGVFPPPPTTTFSSNRLPEISW